MNVEEKSGDRERERARERERERARESGEMGEEKKLNKGIYYSWYMRGNKIKETNILE